MSQPVWLLNCELVYGEQFKCTVVWELNSSRGHPYLPFPSIPAIPTFSPSLPPHWSAHPYLPIGWSIQASHWSVHPSLPLHWSVHLCLLMSLLKRGSAPKVVATALLIVVIVMLGMWKISLFLLSLTILVFLVFILYLTQDCSSVCQFYYFFDIDTYNTNIS